MVDERSSQAPSTEVRKRKNRFKKPPNAKKMKVPMGMGKKTKVSRKLKKLFRKRASNYNSDSEDDNESEPESMDEGEKMEGEDNSGQNVGDVEHGGEGEGGLDVEEEGSGEEESLGEDEEGSDEDEGVPVMKFSASCNAFKTAFQKVMNLSAEHETLGPILSAQKKLVIAKLAEEVTKKKFDKEKKKEKISVDERGHVKPANFLDTHDKVLIGIATKGVVKFFNAVNKAQTAQKGLNPLRFKDAKALTKRRKEAFVSELKRASGNKSSTAKDDSDQPLWAPLQKNFMLTNSRLKDWDKNVEEAETEI